LMQDRRRQFDEIFLQRTAAPYIGSKADLDARSREVCFAPMYGHRQTDPSRPKSAE
jgi:hypothetical protein